METIKNMLKKVSPIIISPTKSSLTISISKRFFLFQLMNKLMNVIEENPHLNFIALLKSYKVLGRFLDGTLHEFYRDRNRLYFKNFFLEKKLYKLVKNDLEYLYPTYKDIKMTITKRGVIVYDNYKKNEFNVLLMTIHSGIWVPENIEKKLSIPEKERFKEEDIDTHKIYYKLILEKGGIWIDNKQSRFVIDFNRNLKRAIYADNSEEWLTVVWNKELTKKESDAIYASYREFYFTLTRLIETYQFNIIFDGHSMKDGPGRANISFATKHIPTFYMPIVKSMRRKMISMGYQHVSFNKPFSGGYILKWLNTRFPNVFISSMEVNKKLYMTKNRMKTINRKLNKIADDLLKIFDIESDHDKDY